MKLREMVISALSEEPGVISFARMISLLLVVAVLSWDTSYLVFGLRHALTLAKTSGEVVAAISNALPSGGALAAQGVFMTIFYGVNKVTGAYAEKAPVAPAP